MITIILEQQNKEETLSFPCVPRIGETVHVSTFGTYFYGTVKDVIYERKGIKVDSGPVRVRVILD